MKKLLIVGLLLSLGTGCGRGWLPCRFRGAQCNGNCIGAAPALPHCDNCSNTAGYGGYENEVVDGGYYGGGQIINEGPIVGGGIVNPNPAMSNLQAAP